jgi:glycosyltransferase involved in cell wall biosynthesis
MIRDALDARMVDSVSVSESRLARLVQRVAGVYPAMALVAFRQRATTSAYVTMSENEAIVLAALLKLARRRVPLVVVGHHPAKAAKRAAWRLARVHTHIDRILSLSTVQAERLAGLGVPREKLDVLPFGIDAEYWRPERATPRRHGRPYVFAAGLQDRDHHTVAEAIQGLDVDLVVAAASQWATTGNEFEGRQLLPGVLVEAPELEGFRDGYAGAAAVVTSVVETDYPAGTTTLLEGMALARPAVVARTEGGGDYVTDRRRVLRRGPQRSTSAAFPAVDPSPRVQGQTGFYFAPGDVEGLRSILRWILDHPAEAAAVGARARVAVEELYSIEDYVDRIVGAVRESIERKTRAGA